MSRTSLIVLVAAIAVLAGAAAVAGEKETIVCPVCGFIVEKSMAPSAELNGAVYYFCEPGCKAYALQYPDVVTSGKAYDVVCGMEIEKAKAVRLEHGGRELYFCADACRAKYSADPAHYEIDFDVVANEVRPAREMKYQTEYEGRTFRFVSEENKKAFLGNPDAYLFAECPISGRVQLRKDFAFKTEYEGKTYYFRSEACMERFKKAPQEILKVRAAGGYIGCVHEGGADSSGGGSASKGCPFAKEHKGCPRAKEKTESGKKGTGAGCSATPSSDRCFAR